MSVEEKKRSATVLPSVIFTRYTGNQNWATPRELYKQLDREFHFTMDPCPLNSTWKNTWKNNGLDIIWRGRVYVNPPYSEPKKWIAKALCDLRYGFCELVVMLLKADVSTKWFHELVLPNYSEIRAVRGRLQFNDAGRAPFPSMIVIFRKASEERK